MKKTIIEIFDYLKDEFKLIPIAYYSHIIQNGDYIILNGFDRENPNTKNLNIKVIFARNTYDKEVYSGLNKIEAFEEKIFKLLEKEHRKEILTNMEIKGISESLYAYVFDLRIPMKKVL